jgi:hypothetical protein
LISTASEHAEWFNLYFNQPSWLSASLTCGKHGAAGFGGTTSVIPAVVLLC